MDTKRDRTVREQVGHLDGRVSFVSFPSRLVFLPAVQLAPAISVLLEVVGTAILKPPVLVLVWFPTIGSALVLAISY